MPCDYLNSKNFLCSVDATVVGIVPNFGWYYIACNKCNKKMTDPIQCNKCPNKNYSSGVQVQSDYKSGRSNFNNNIFTI